MSPTISTRTRFGWRPRQESPSTPDDLDGCFLKEFFGPVALGARLCSTLAPRSYRVPAACSADTLASRSGFVAEHAASTGRAWSGRFSLLTARCVLAPNARGLRPPIRLA